jgi:catechol 2,3-dioxygenase-like lactoylglutathione lyase family enzyme
MPAIVHHGAAHCVDHFAKSGQTIGVPHRASAQASPLRVNAIQSSMLANNDCVATAAVKDLNTAKRFYEGTLGLRPVAHEGEEAITYQTGAAKLLVYRSRFAGTNRATAVTWIVGPEIESLVRELKAQGVAFEHYDMPGVQRDGDIHSAGNLKNAWFKDPDGNVLALVSG